MFKSTFDIILSEMTFDWRSILPSLWICTYNVKINLTGINGVLRSRQLPKLSTRDRHCRSLSYPDLRQLETFCWVAQTNTCTLRVPRSRAQPYLSNLLPVKAMLNLANHFWFNLSNSNGTHITTTFKQQIIVGYCAVN